MNILIAPNAFKNSLDATEASEAIRKGLEMSDLDCTCECFPIGDGGDGTAHLITEKFKGTKVNIEVLDPLGRKITTSFGLIDDGKTAVIEMADASGLRLLNTDELNPLLTSSYGTGEMLKHALDKGVSKIIIGLGGSATVDGGAGLINALGGRFLDADGKELVAKPGELGDLDSIDLSGIDKRILKCKIVVLCDVDNYLLGDNGAAAVFGPQKGAKEEDVPKLDLVLQKISEAVTKAGLKDMSKVKHGGAAGGLGAAFYAFLNADLVNGAEHFLTITNFAESLEKSQCLITGEGSLDEQTLQGKAPFAVANYAKKKNIPVIGIAGKVPLTESAELNKYFNVLLAIGNQPADLPTAMKNTTENLIRTGALIGNLLSMSDK
jgi:glycerate kinase